MYNKVKGAAYIIPSAAVSQILIWFALLTNVFKLEVILRPVH